MMMRFTKMHGLGNDYVYINGFQEQVPDPAGLAPKVSDRHFGIGSDGLILIEPSRKADARMRIFNADGSEAEMCGNGLRCVSKYVLEHKLAPSRGPFGLTGQTPSFNASLVIETGRGVLTVGLAINDHGKVDSVCVNMGEPILEPAKVPVGLPGRQVVDQPIDVQGLALRMTCVSMGNPHVVIFTEDLDGIDLDRIGPLVEHHPLFPNRTNVHFVRVINRSESRVRTWERGSGVTLACGTGACACCVAGVMTGRMDRACTLHLPGGELSLTWHSVDNCVYMTGPAIEVFEGIWPMASQDLA
jgi:diaminopimelate epimerase